MDFKIGVNLPWFAYGHDFGRNAWGYDGLATSGWKRSGSDRVLRIAEHWPEPVRVTREIALHGEIRCRVRFPEGSAGLPFQFLLQTPEEILLSPRQSIGTENEWITLTAAFAQDRIRAIGIRYPGEFEIESLDVAGVTFDFGRPLVDREFEALREFFGQQPVVRVFLLCDGRAGIDPLQPELFSDLDVLFDAADRRNVQLLPVLLDFHWCDEPRFEGGVQLGGRASRIRDPLERKALLDEVLRPILVRYGQRDSVFAWDVMNEPEWRVREMGGGPVALDEMRAFVSDCTAAIHELTRHPATLGCARRKWVPFWTGLGLDLYQFHWYDNFASEDLFPFEHATTLDIEDKPVLVGEVPTANTRIDPRAFFQSARDSGYAGLLYWSGRAGDSYSNLAAFES